MPSISRCGLTFCTGDRFAARKGSLFAGARSAGALFRIEVDGERHVGEERLIEGRLPYIRDVRRGPTGCSTSSPTATVAACSASNPRKSLPSVPCPRP
ncbi:MAG: PQQ-dependent sugar dehydrogenase [Proteobacteria bacterium]|nr:PQQ-dependent sugar dehydrogenase [Pseudomonadota bacterium]